MDHEDLKKCGVPQDIIDAAKQVGLDAEALLQLLVDHTKEAARAWLDWIRGKINKS